MIRRAAWVVLAWLTALAIAVIRWTEGAWTIRGTIARYLHRRTRPEAHREIARRLENQ